MTEMYENSKKEMLESSRNNPEAILSSFPEEQSARDWVRIPNLDSFLCDVYSYHYHKGFWSIVVQWCTNILSIAFTIAFSAFLIGCVDWPNIFTCHIVVSEGGGRSSTTTSYYTTTTITDDDDNSNNNNNNNNNNNICADLHILREDALQMNTMLGMAVNIYIIVFSVYLLWHMGSFLYTIPSLKRTRDFYRHKLTISDEELTQLEWSAVMERLVELQLYHEKRLDALDITNRILRKENYLMALIHHHIVDFHSPFHYFIDSFFSNTNHHRSNSNGRPRKRFNITKKHRKRKQKKGYAAMSKINTGNDMDDDDADDEEEEEEEDEDKEDEEDEEEEEEDRQIQTTDDIMENEEKKKHIKTQDIGYLGKVLEWNLLFFLNSWVFTRDGERVQLQTLDYPEKLQRKLYLLGIINLLLIPFTLVFRIIFFFLKNAESLKTNHSSSHGGGQQPILPPQSGSTEGNSAGNNSNRHNYREWTLISRYQIRELNELLHQLEWRLMRSHPYAQEYLWSVNYYDKYNMVYYYVLDLLTYMCGSVMAVLLVITFVDSNVLLHIQVYGRSLVWYLAIFTALYGLCKSNIPSITAPYIVVKVNKPSPGVNPTLAGYDLASTAEVLIRLSPEASMKRLGRYTHIVRKEWHGKCHTLKVRDEFLQMYQSKFQIFIREIIDVFTTPFILMFTLPRCIEGFVKFMKEHTVHVPGVGHVCSLARFDYNPKSDTITPTPMSTLGFGPTTSAPVQDFFAKAKLEQSFLSFAMNYPHWKANPHQSQLLQSIIHCPPTNVSNLPMTAMPPSTPINTNTSLDTMSTHPMQSNLNIPISNKNSIHLKPPVVRHPNTLGESKEYPEEELEEKDKPESSPRYRKDRPMTESTKHLRLSFSTILQYKKQMQQSANLTGTALQPNHSSTASQMMPLPQLGTNMTETQMYDIGTGSSVGIGLGANTVWQPQLSMIETDSYVEMFDQLNEQLQKGIIPSPPTLHDSSQLPHSQLTLPLHNIERAISAPAADSDLETTDPPLVSLQTMDESHRIEISTPSPHAQVSDDTLT